MGGRLLIGTDGGQCLQYMSTDGKTTLEAGNSLSSWVWVQITVWSWEIN